MNRLQENASPASAPSYGFHCALQPQLFEQGVALVEVARVAHEVRQRLERVRSALGGAEC
jgi:hypothetical protein